MSDDLKFTAPLDSETPYTLVYATSDYTYANPTAGYPGYDIDTVTEANARSLDEMGVSDLEWYETTAEAEEEIDPLNPPAAFTVGRWHQLHALDWRTSEPLDDANEPDDWQWFDVIAGLSDYPLIDDEVHSRVETERLDEYIADAGLWDLRRALRMRDRAPDDETAECVEDETGPFADEPLTVLFHYAMQSANEYAEHHAEGTYVDTDKLADTLTWLLGWDALKTPPMRLSGWESDAYRVRFDRILETDDPQAEWERLWREYAASPGGFDPMQPFGVGGQGVVTVPDVHGFRRYLTA